MKLLTEELKRKIPGLYETDGEKDKTCYVKLFNPYGNQTWYICEYGGGDAFGYVDLGYGYELGYFNIKELEDIRIGGFGGKIERDKFFEPTKFSEIS